MFLSSSAKNMVAAVCWLVLCGASALGEPLPRIEVTEVIEIPDPADPITCIRLRYTLVNPSDRDFCLIFRNENGEIAKMDQEGNQEEFAYLEIQFPNGAFSPPMNGFPDTAFESVQDTARYDFFRINARSQVSSVARIEDEYVLPDRSPALYRLIVEGVWCDVVERFGLRLPLLFSEVDLTQTQTAPAKDGRPAIIGLPSSEEIFVASAPTKLLTVRE